MSYHERLIKALHPEASLTYDESARALCAQTDPEVFFPLDGGSIKAARQVCARCDIRIRCAEVAIANGERAGVWGGLSERQLRAARTSREAAA